MGKYTQPAISSSPGARLGENAAVSSMPLEIVIARSLVVTSWLMLALPPAVGILMLVVTPPYFLPVVQSPTGIGLLLLAAFLETVGVLATWWGTKRFRSRIGPLLALELLVTLVCVFPTLWLIILGPALITIVTKS